jgi:hypothetical protein
MLHELPEGNGFGVHCGPTGEFRSINSYRVAINERGRFQLVLSARRGGGALLAKPDDAWGMPVFIASNPDEALQMARRIMDECNGGPAELEIIRNQLADVTAELDVTKSELDRAYKTLASIAKKASSCRLAATVTQG